MIMIFLYFDDMSLIIDPSNGGECTWFVCENGGMCIRNAAGQEMCRCPYGTFGNSCQLKRTSKLIT